MSEDQAYENDDAIGAGLVAVAIRCHRSDGVCEKAIERPQILRRSQGDVDRRTDAEDTVDIGMPDEFRLWDRSMSDTLLSDGIVHSRNVLRPTS
jgi:hypothetical protein